MQAKNQVVVVTGAASGLGEATARRLAKAGNKVALLDHNADLVGQVAAEIGGIGIRCDVTNEQEVISAFSQVEKSLGVARVLVNCAGVARAAKVVGKEGAMPLSEFVNVININLIGTFSCLNVFANAVAKLEPVTDSGERGVIINTASVAAWEGQIGQAAYSATKAGVVGMTLPIAREFARHGIRIMAIAPGIMGTPLIYNMPEKVQDSLRSTIPFPKRFGEPDEYAKLAQHIIENELLNGSVIRLDAAIRMEAT